MYAVVGYGKLALVTGYGRVVQVGESISIGTSRIDETATGAGSVSLMQG